MTAFSLKTAALILMVLDHIGAYFPMDYALYLLLRSVGRLSYPLFLLCMTQSYVHTHSRKAYLLRLYTGSLFMTFFRLAIDTYLPTSDGYGYGNHNIFLPMLLIGLLISTIETFQSDQRKGLQMALGLFALQVLYTLVPNYIPAARQVSGDILTGIIPNLSLNEYGQEFLFLGLLMYFLRDRQDLFSIAYILFSIVQFSEEALWGDGSMPTQWIMVFALPLMLRYNGERGRSWKYFFYLFYPAHTFLLFYLANFVLIG